MTAETTDWWAKLMLNPNTSAAEWQDYYKAAYNIERNSPHSHHITVPPATIENKEIPKCERK